MALGVALGILLPALLFSRMFFGDRYEREIERRVREPLAQYSEMLSQSMSVAIWNVDRTVANQIVHAVMRNPDVVRVLVEDDSGTKFVDSEVFERRHGEVLRKDQAVMIDGRSIGHVYVELTTERVKQELWSDFWRISAALVAQVMTSFGLILLLFERRIVQPLKYLEASTEKLARGELEQTVELKRDDEIGNLARGLDRMRVDISGLLSERDLRNTDLQQQLSERLKAEMALRATEAKFVAIFQTSPVPLLVLRKENDFALVDINDTGVRQFGVTRAELLGMDHRAIWRESKDFETVTLIASQQGELHGYEAWMRSPHKDEQMLCQVSGRMVTLDGETLLILALEDVTERKNTEAVIWNQANFDRLTGLPNRHMFLDRLEQSLYKAQRTNTRLGLMFLDLDRFKEVNDTLGHEMGDLLLAQAAERLKKCVRESDTVARMGGDEFAILLDNLAEASDATMIAQHILQKISMPFQLGDDSVFVSCSIGITFYPEDASESAALLKHADQAMYAAKSEGRNCFHHFTPAMQHAAQERMRLINDLRGALAADQFHVHYQPIVDSATGIIRKAEALIRWAHPIRGLISPAHFIPVAEETRMIVEIGDWIFREAARQVAKWRKEFHPDFQISVNVSPVQFRSENVSHEAWIEYLRSLDLPGQSIAVEITEGLLLDAGTLITDRLLAFRDAGIMVSLDDFGTGYSSLSYIRKFDIDYIKIDRSFVRNLASSSDDLALCDSIIVMAHKLGLRVIAEGVETDVQSTLLVESGCDYLQGFLYGKALPPEEFEAMLRMRNAVTA